MSDENKIKAGAAAMFDAFEQKTRANGDAYFVLKDGSPQWMTEVIHAAHGDLMPDDWRYSTIRNLCSAIADCDDLEETHELIDSEVDVYTSALTAWLASNVRRLAYCDDAAEELGKPESMSQALQYGQYQEISETLSLLIAALEEHAPDVTE